MCVVLWCCVCVCGYVMLCVCVYVKLGVCLCDVWVFGDVMLGVWFCDAGCVVL